MMPLSKAYFTGLLLLAICSLTQAQSPNPPDDATWCYLAYPNGPEGCDDIGLPVCGYYTERCIFPPCNILQYNYANPCQACLDNRDYYLPGACPLIENQAEETAYGEWEVWLCEAEGNGESEWWHGAENENESENEEWVNEEWVNEGEVAETEIWICTDL